MRFETQISDALSKAGWSVAKSGWPDFFCWREVDGKRQVMLVEVKSGSDDIRPNQSPVHSLLLEAGLPVFIVTPSRYSPQISRRVKAGELSYRHVSRDVLAVLESVGATLLRWGGYSGVPKRKIFSRNIVPWHSNSEGTDGHNLVTDAGNVSQESVSS